MVRRKRNKYGDLIMPVAVLLAMIVYFNPDYVDKAIRLLTMAAVIGVCVLAGYYIYSRRRKNILTSSMISANEDAVVDLQSSMSDQAPVDGKLISNEKWSIELINALEWKRFEELCSLYFEEKGYKAKVTRQGADGGVDINLFKDSYSESKPFGIVQCKAWNSYKVGVKPVRELYGVMASEGAPLGVFITSGDYTKEAREFSVGKHIKLMNGAQLLQQIIELPETSQINLLDKITSGDYTTPSCPSCGIKMIARTAKKGPHAGSQFWGCSNYPNCRNTLRVTK